MQTDGFLMGRTGAQLGYQSKKVRYLGTYGFGATTWVRGTQGTSLTHTLSLSSEIQSSATSQVMLGAGASLGQLSLIDAIGTTNAQTVGTRPSGSQRFVTIEAREAFVWQFAAMWRLDQMLEGRLYRPVGDNAGSPTNRNLINSLGIARLWTRDQVGLRTRVGIVQTLDYAPSEQTTIPGRVSEFVEALLGWRHDFTPAWTSDLAAGAFVMRMPGASMSPSPSGSASLAYQREGQRMALRAARTVEPNGYIGAILERSLVSLSAGMPIGRWQALNLSAMATLEHDAILSAASGPASTANFLYLQAGAQYRLSRMFMVQLQYMFRDQFSASASAPGEAQMFNFRQQTVMLTLEGIYPAGPSTEPVLK